MSRLLRLILAAVVLCVGATPLPLFAQEDRIKPARTDGDGDALPRDAIARMGTTRFWHREQVEHVAFGSDGASIATGRRGNVTVWSADTGRVSASFPLGFRTYVRDVSLSPGSKLLAWTVYPGHTQVAELKTGRLLFTATVFGEWPTF